MKVFLTNLGEFEVVIVFVATESTATVFSDAPLITAVALISIALDLLMVL